MDGQTLPPEIYFLGRCDQKGGGLPGFGEITISFRSEDLPQRAGDLYLARAGRINRKAEGIYDLLLLTLAEPLEGEPWPRWDEILEPFANPSVLVEELGRVELIREGGQCNEGGDKVTRGYTFTVQTVVATKDPNDFDDLMRDDHDYAAIRNRRLLALALAGQFKVVIALRAIQRELPLEEGNDGADAGANSDGRQQGLHL